jgi:signal transduction histidine kinase/ActR/RegA family two-component response regulator
MPSGCAVYEVRNDGSRGSDYVVKDFNPASLVIEGKTRNEVIGKSLLDLRPTIDEYGLISVFQEVWRTGEPALFPSTQYVDEGYASWYENRVFKLPTGEIVAIYNDVTERRRLDDELVRSKNLLANTEKTGRIGGWLFYPKTLTQTWTDETFRILEIDSAQGEPRVPEGLEFVAPASRRQAEQAVQRAIELGEPFDQEWEIVTGRGNKRWVHSVATIHWEQGEIESISGCFQDITDRKRAEEALRASEATMRYIIKHDPSAIAVYDRDLRYIAVSDRYLSDYEIDGESIVGKHHYEVFPEIPQKWRDVHQRVLAGAIESEEDDAFVRFDGSLTYNTWECRPWYEQDGSIGGIITYTQVTTERMAAEEALRVSEEQLRQSQKMEAVGQLAGGIAHDFNNLLTIILGYTDMILAGSDSQGLPVLDDLREIKRAAERAASLTRQILAFSRRQALEPEVVSLNAVLAGMEPLLRRTLGEDINLVTVLSPDPCLTEVDPHQFEQVLVNMALNARDAMPAGGNLTLEIDNVELGKDCAQKHPEITPGSYVMLAVSDTGVGMDESTREHIFEPFFTTKAPGAGTGLGLATVYGVVRQSGGSITVHSEPSQGTSFKIYLPRATAPAPAQSPSTARATLALGQETILVVEDEESLRSLAVRTLKELGYTVLEAATASEALELLATTSAPVDLLLTDVVLRGGMQGNDLAMSLKTSRPQLPVLYMSGYARYVVAHAGRLEEGISLLEKPFTPDTLARKVREVLDSAGASARGTDGRD